MKTIYLCGPVSGRPEQEYKDHFEKVQVSLVQTAAAEGVPLGTISPTSLATKDSPWEAALKTCIRHMVDCDGIAVLQGWERSKGCLLELEIAGRLKIPVVYIEPPVDECGISDFSNHPIFSDVLRYYKKRYFQAEADHPISEHPGDIALLETVNRYLDPHGFEYIDREDLQGGVV